MHILAIGLNHTTAPLALRERLALSEEEIRALLAPLAGGERPAGINELVILSTCNRIEVYAACASADFEGLEMFLSGTRNMPLAEIRPHLYRYRDAEAARHLFEVAAGLDSLVLGEPQILGQVTRALTLASSAGCTGALLHRLFQAAIHAGKRARAETAIGRNPASIPSLAASLAERVFHPLSEAQVVVLGAGEMAELVIEALRKRGAGRICVVNRTLPRARALAERWNAEIETFENLSRVLRSADVLIAATAAAQLVLSAAEVAEALRTRPARPLVLIDIAVPRDIDPEAAALPGVRLYDMDRLNAALEHSLAARVAETRRVRAILEEELHDFLHFLHSLDMLPLIVALHTRAEQIRRAELEKTLRRLPNLSDSERARIDTLTQALVNKLLDAPIRRLRAEATCPHGREYATVARTLFDLPSDGLCHLSGESCSLPTALN